MFDDNEKKVGEAEPKLEKGMLLGTEKDSNELRIGGANRVVKAITVKRLHRDQQWSAQMIKGVTGVPWDPRGAKAASREAVAGQSEERPQSKSRYLKGTNTTWTFLMVMAENFDLTTGQAQL